MERGSIQAADRAAASPCNSLEPDEGREGGAWGQRCRAGEGQQEGVRQLAGSELQHLQVGAEPELAEAEACGAGIAPGAAAATPNINASSIVTNLWTKAFIRMRPDGVNLHGLSLGRTIVRLKSAVILFLKPGKPMRDSAEKPSSQFFRVPQSSMDLP
jgi:hypothetical protein